MFWVRAQQEARFQSNGLHHQTLIVDAGRMGQGGVEGSESFFVIACFKVGFCLPGLEVIVLQLTTSNFLRWFFKTADDFQGQFRGTES